MDQEREARFLDLLEADQNDPSIQYALGLCYLRGDGTQENGAEAQKWLRRAAEQGHEEARALLDSCQKQPEEPVAITEQTLPDWCLRAEEGDAEAQYRTADYFLTHCPESGQADAERYLAMAADQGHPQACLLLARQKLSRGESAEAVILLRNAADCNLSEAAELLGECYSQGNGVAADPEEAERRFVQAAQLGSGEQMLHLALRYALGDGVAASTGKALSWVKKARDHGLADAREQFDARCAAEAEKSRIQQEEEAARQAEAEKKAAQKALQAEEAARRKEEEAEARRAEDAQRKAREEAYRAEEARKVAQEKARLQAQEEARQKEAQKQQAQAQKKKEAEEKQAAEAVRLRNEQQAQRLQRRTAQAQDAAFGCGAVLVCYSALMTLLSIVLHFCSRLPSFFGPFLWFFFPDSSLALTLLVVALPGLCLSGWYILSHCEHNFSRLKKLAILTLGVQGIAVAWMVWSSLPEMNLFSIAGYVLLLAFYGLLCAVWNAAVFVVLLKIISMALTVLFGVKSLWASPMAAIHALLHKS